MYAAAAGAAAQAAYAIPHMQTMASSGSVQQTGQMLTQASPSSTPTSSEVRETTPLFRCSLIYNHIRSESACLQRKGVAVARVTHSMIVL